MDRTGNPTATPLANKYTEDGEIRIEAVQDNAATRIMITDTGISMSKELVTAILTQTYETENNSHGFGYKIILELLCRIQGELAIDAPAGAVSTHKTNLMQKLGVSNIIELSKMVQMF